MGEDSVMSVGIEKTRQSHIWKRQGEDWYQERCGSRSVFSMSSRSVGVSLIRVPAVGTSFVRQRRPDTTPSIWDIADRGCPLRWQGDFLTRATQYPNIICNPPFDRAREFADHALKIAQHKVAMIFPTARLNAARWLEDTPLARIWMLTPRPSMPPGETILRGEKPGGGKTDYVWLIWDQAHKGPASVSWLRRDEHLHGSRQ
jgi:hypothetical protein